MKEEEILSGLGKIFESLQIEVRYEKGDFSGGYCILKEKPMVIVQNNLSAAQKIKILARELAQMDLQNVFLVPALREVIDEAMSTTGIKK
ncbi:MAG: hypothetical protein AAB354_09805 [candidate division KSB1 bacterium]